MSDAIITIQNYNNGEENKNLTGTITVDGKITKFDNLIINDLGTATNIDQVNFTPQNNGGSRKSSRSSRKTNRKRYLGKGKRGKSMRRRH